MEINRPALISCVLRAGELKQDAHALVLFPEGACSQDVAQACAQFPESIIAAALVENGYCRGYAVHRGQNKIDYLKLGNDGQTRGSGIANQSPVFTVGDVTIGMLICMDVQNPELAQSVIGKILEAPSPLRILCIPADMSADWHAGDCISSMFKDINVVVCNHTKAHPTYRCKSFITDKSCRKLVVQKSEEPVHAWI